MRWIGGSVVALSLASCCQGFVPAAVPAGRLCAAAAGPNTAARQKHPRHTCRMAYDVRYSPNSWPNQPLEPGVGGIWPGDPNAQTHKAMRLPLQVTIKNKAGEVVAQMDVPDDRYIYFAFEDEGHDLPLQNGRRMCRNGCCTTCAMHVQEGKVKMEGGLGLLKDLRRDGWTLTCCSYATTDVTLQLQDEDEVYLKQWGETFESGGVEWGGFLPEED
ncbi:ferredoxin [Tribonema minus]|uniref:Ferredoxin n=1 Tax=Tribonema minus TaxID=303371 RepID=A0A835Z8Q8_9STRA|nr:ferredoxin [Tribonema minus]